MDLREFLDLFLTESREHLEAMGPLLLKARAQELTREEINDLFRHAHSIKGMASSMGIRSMADLAHAMEDLFHAWRDLGIAPAPAALDLVQRGSDALAAQVDALAAGKAAADQGALCAALRAASGEGPGGSAAAGDPGARGAAAAVTGDVGAGDAAAGAGVEDGGRLELAITLNQGTPLPAARALVLLKQLADLGTILGVEPPREAIARGPFEGSLRVTLSSRLAADRAREIVLGLPDVSGCRVDPARPDRREAERRKDTDRRQAAGPVADEAPGGAPPADGGAGRHEGIGTIRVATERMDRLLDGIGELILDRERLKRILDARDGGPAWSIFESLARSIDALRDEVMAMRMIPFSSLVPRLQRMARDLSRRLDKPIELVVRGSDVAVDRSILEEMLDPLQHLLRNSIDHGIEGAAERRAAGKPPEGRIEIDLCPKESRVVLSVQDDGRGIDPGALRKVAVERRFLPREAAERLSDDEALTLVTLPGFSTAATTTDISGRGVGMDVVLTQVRKLGGRLTVQSRVGGGSRFDMDFPPTMTVTRAFLCRASGEVYAVPVSVVQNTLEVDRDGLQASHGEQVVRRDEEVVTVLPLAGLLRGETAAASYPPSFPALLYREGARTYALAVEEILGEEEIVVKPLRHPLELLPQYAGAAILNDGRIALILDPANLARATRGA